ncbi:Alpha/Beta hydrolase protein [Microdochium trichocladiopsis]|uniref:Alpha/Beta hydrolase protein n=1 Tax=Microdochium trichocladiopsis TaxID=1682393 RepID=A0A9P8Y9F4_9PEZI|nr:Alpha/Beta hydrolase protein [Microdochium trichocladiopsis]KAH7033141.1 Alpha/Beta hydrolase protein [Microdochium trichocladiopsis]
MPPRPKRQAATRIPQASDFDHLGKQHPPLHVSLVFPEVVETTTSIMILFHGLGDSEVSFAGLARNLKLPGVLAIAVRGVEPLPPALLGLPPDVAAGVGDGTRHFHWGDDLDMDPSTGELDPDPGFDKAKRAVLDGLVFDTLVGKLGWRTEDMLLFGFGQGGSLALGLASRLRDPEGISDARVVDVTEGDPQAQKREEGEEMTAFKGVVSIGGPLPPSMVPSLSSREKARTPVLVCHGRNSEVVDEDAMEFIRKEIRDVREVKWTKGRSSGDDGMPRNREEMLPIMQFLAERLASDQWS